MVTIESVNKLVINLPDRPERLESFKEDFKHLGGSFEVIEGERDQRKPYAGIARSHQRSVRYAKDKGWDKVLIMEDDVIYPAKEKALPYINEALKKLPEDWDVILGGVYYLRNEKRINAYWRKVYEFCALHWYIVNEKAYDTILNYECNGHIDRWLGNQGLNIYLPRRFWAIQKDGYSDNVNKLTNYNTTLLTNFEILR